MTLYASRYPFTPLARSLFFGFIRLYFRPQISGKEYLPTEGKFLLVSNHNSHADTAVIFSTFPAAMRSRVVVAAARDYFFTGDWRQVVSRTLFNAIPVDRETVRGEDPLRHVVRALDEGYGVVIYPEGTRSRDGSIGPFRRGIGRLIASFPNLPVIPLRLFGADRALPKGAAIPRPYTIQVHFGPPLYFQANLNNRAGWQTIADTMRQAVIRLEAK
jgi:1-acyl-sn-glycerol-3-phosphate acyltransferase